MGGPSADWWQQLSLAIAWGLSFATVITLVLTPCLLILGARTSTAWRRLRQPLAGDGAIGRRDHGVADGIPQAAE